MPDFGCYVLIVQKIRVKYIIHFILKPPLTTLYFQDFVPQKKNGTLIKSLLRPPFYIQDPFYFRNKKVSSHIKPTCQSLIVIFNDLLNTFAFPHSVHKRRVHKGDYVYRLGYLWYRYWMLFTVNLFRGPFSNARCPAGRLLCSQTITQY